MSSLYALNLFDLAPNESYRAYSRRSVDAVGRHGGRVRPPLTDLTEDERNELTALVGKVS